MDEWDAGALQGGRALLLFDPLPGFDLSLGFLIIGRWLPTMYKAQIAPKKKKNQT
jgi:hypothetical protein